MISTEIKCDVDLDACAIETCDKVIESIDFKIKQCQMYVLLSAATIGSIIVLAMEFVSSDVSRMAIRLVACGFVLLVFSFVLSILAALQSFQVRANSYKAYIALILGELDTRPGHEKPEKKKDYDRHIKHMIRGRKFATNVTLQQRAAFYFYLSAVVLFSLALIVGGFIPIM